MLACLHAAPTRQSFWPLPPPPPHLQVIDIDPQDPITSITSVPDFPEDSYLVLLTQQGLIKKTPLSAFKTINRSGLMALKTAEGDRLSWAGLCDDRCSVLLASSGGSVLHCR